MLLGTERQHWQLTCMTIVLQHHRQSLLIVVKGEVPDCFIIWTVVCDNVDWGLTFRITVWIVMRPVFNWNWQNEKNCFIQCSCGFKVLVKDQFQHEVEDQLQHVQVYISIYGVSKGSVSICSSVCIWFKFW